MAQKKTAAAAAPTELSPGGAQVVAALVEQGHSYDEAVAMLRGGAAAPAPSKKALDEQTKKLVEGDDSDLPPVEDVEDKYDIVDVSLEKRPEFRTFLDDLWTQREALEDVPKKTRYRVTFEIGAPEWDWLLHRTIQEGQARKDVDYSPQKALTLLLKQQKALDPTRGGKRAFGGSGPREGFNPATGDWTKK